MKLLAINGSPRRNKNTGQLLEQVVAGARSKGAETELVHLMDLPPYRGCISCFACKQIGGRSYGRCVVKDSLQPILQKAHEADALVLGTPVYLFTETSLMRAFLERLCFQYLLYSNIKPPLSTRKNGVGLIYTMNMTEAQMVQHGLDKVTGYAKMFLESLFAPCEVLYSCDTLQFDDYSKYDTDRFDASAKQKRHHEVFPADLKKAYTLGERLVI